MRHNQNQEQLIADWKYGYLQLAEISKQQLVWLKEKMPTDPDEWDAMQRWSQQRAELRGHIEDIQHQLIEQIGNERLAELYQAELASVVETARVLTFEAARKIELAMINTGSELNNTQNHRKLSSAYSGQDNESQESFFFDEKK